MMHKLGGFVMLAWQLLHVYAVLYRYNYIMVIVYYSVLFIFDYILIIFDVGVDT